MNLNDYLAEKKKDREVFSIHSLINKDKLTLEQAQQLIKLAEKDDSILKLYIILCPKCKSKHAETENSIDSYKGRSLKCYNCKESFRLVKNSIELICDPRSLTERFNIKK